MSALGPHVHPLESPSTCLVEGMTAGLRRRGSLRSGRPPDDAAHGGPENHRRRVRLRCRNEKAEGREAPEKGPPYLIGVKPSFSFYLALPFAALFLSPLSSVFFFNGSSNSLCERQWESSKASRQFLFFIYLFFFVLLPLYLDQDQSPPMSSGGVSPF